MKYIVRLSQLVLFGFVFLLMACSRPPAPKGYSTTLIEVEPSTEAAALPGTAVTEAPISSTELVMPTPEATISSPVVSTSEPNSTAAVPATAVSTEPDRAVLTITSPPEEAQLGTGSELLVAGYVAAGTAVSVNIQLQMGPHLLIDHLVQSNADSGEWELTVTLPHSVAGMGELIVRTETETAVQKIQINYDANRDETGISIDASRPGDGQMAVAGHPLFFEGAITNAIDSSIIIGLYTDNCTTIAARQSFTLDAATAVWSGFVNLPQMLNGRSCAFISTGSPESGLWREVQLWLPVIHPGEDMALDRIILGNSLQNPFKAGEDVYLFGSVVDAAGKELVVSWFAEDGETVVGEETAVVDALGFWEANIILPTDLAGTTVLQLYLEDGEDTITLQIELIVE